MIEYACFMNVKLEKILVLAKCLFMSRPGVGGAVLQTSSLLINRPGVAGVVLQSPPSFIHSLTD